MSISLIEPDPSKSTKGVKLVASAKIHSPFTPKPADVAQGDLAGCPVVATLVALAHTRPAQIVSMLGPPHEDRVFSRRSAADDVFRWTTFYHDVMLPGRGSATRISGLLYHRYGHVVYAHLPGGRAGWPSLIEKAYAVWRGRNSYDRLDKRAAFTTPPGVSDVMCDLVGRHDLASIETGQLFGSVKCTDRTGVERALTSKDVLSMAGRASKRPTVAVSLAQNPGHSIDADHTYAVLGTRKKAIRLRNPHGGSSAHVTISLADFMKAFRAVCQAQ